MAHFKRRRPKNRRAGCLMCKAWKMNGFARRRADGEGFGSHRARYFATAATAEYTRESAR